MVGESYTGLSTTGQPEATNTGVFVTGGNAILLPVTLTTLTNNALLIAVAGTNAGTAFTCTSGHGENCSHMATDANGVGLYMLGPNSPAGSYTSNSDITGNGTGNPVNIVAVSLAPPGAASSGGFSKSNKLMRLGEL